MKSTPEILSDSIHDLYMNGYTTASGGNISQKDDEGVIWMSPSQVDKGNLKPDQFVCFKNNEWLGDLKPSMEYPFHFAIYENFPGARAVCHIHSPVLVALSCLRNHMTDYFEISDFNISAIPYAVPGSKELANYIVEAFKEKPELVLMKNHGVIAYGEDINMAVQKIIRLEKKILRAIGVYSIHHLGQGFDLKNNHSISYYEERIKYFLRIRDEFLKLEKLDSEEKYYSVFKLSSYCETIRNGTNVNLNLIPESYLVLKDLIQSNEAPDDLRINQFLHEWNLKTPVLMFNEGTIVAIGDSLFNLYDKMEVLYFTLNVFLLARKMGKLEVLSPQQIKDLKFGFLS